MRRGKFIARASWTTTNSLCRALLIVSLVLGTIAQGHAATYTWGNAGTAWSGSSDWGSASIPGIGDVALFNLNSAYSAQPTLSVAASAGALWDTGSGSLGIGGASILTISGTTINSNTGVGIEMDANAGALAITAPITMSGNQQWINNSGGLLTVSNNVKTSGDLLTVAGSGNSLISGVISGGGGALTLNGPGLLTLTGSSTFSTGNVTINGGTLMIAGGGTIGGGSSQNIPNNGVFIYNSSALQTLSGIISGSGSIYINGSGTLSLAGTSTYTGLTALNSGTLLVSSSASPLGLGSTLSISGGTFATATKNPVSFAGQVTRGINFLGNFDFGPAGSGSSSNGDALTLASSISLGNATRIIAVDTYGYVSLTGAISDTSGTSGLTFTSPSGNGGQLYISNSGNTFGGPVTILSGEVGVSGSGALGASNLVIIDGGRLDISDSAGNSLSTNLGSALTIQIGSSANTTISTKGSSGVTFGGVISNRGSEIGSWGKQGSGLFQLTGVSSYTGSTTVSNGTVQIAGGNNRLPTGTVLDLGQTGSTNLGVFDLNGNNQQVAGIGSLVGTSTAGSNIIMSANPATLTLGGGGGYTYGSGTASNPGVIVGAVTLVMSGSGIQTLGGSNSFNGGTNINAGTLEFAATGSMPSSGTVSVANGATLAVAFGSAGQVTSATSGIGSLGALIGSTIIGGSGSQGAPVSWSAGAVLGLDTTTASATYSGAITDTTGGSLGLTKLGGNTLVLAGSNTYSGNTTISAGTLQIGAGGTTGSILATSNVVNNGALVFSRNDAYGGSFAPAISGNGAVTVSSGTLTLTAANSYQGSTNVAPGAQLVLGSGGSLGSSTAVSVSGALAVAYNTSGNTISAGSALSLAGSATLNMVDGYNTALQVANGISLGNASTLRFDISGTSSLDQIIDGGALNVTGTSKLEVPSGLAAGTYQLLSFSGAAPSLSSLSLLSLTGGSQASTYQLSTTATSGFIDLVVASTAASYTNPNYTLAAAAAAHSIIVGGSSSITATLANSGSGSNPDNINFSGLTATTVSGGTINGLSVGGTNLAASNSFSNTGLSFTSNTPGLYLITPTVSVSGANGTTPVLTSAGTDSVSVLGHAVPVLSGATIMFGPVHAGYSGTLQGSTISISNSNGNLANLKTSGGSASAGGITLSGDLSGLTPGGSAGSLSALASVTGSTPAGVNSQLFMLTFADDSALSGASSNLGSISITASGVIYTGQGIWNQNGSGNWSSFANWTTAGGVPGISGSLSTNDTATFGNVIGSNTATVTLDTAPLVSALSFDNTGGYSIVASGTNFLTLGNSTTAAPITVTGGTQSISAPLVLSSSSGAGVTLSGGGDLAIPGNILDASGGSAALTLGGDGSGLLTLSGSNNFGGGMTELNGTLQLDGASSLLAGSSLTIGSGNVPGAIFAQPLAISQLAPVPEPGTFALLVIAALAGLGIWQRKISSQT